ncbi:MAG: biotin/lipoyl-containing protein, partial [Azonexus sp.]
HPGYGFLSENAEFSRRLEEEGIKFIGPKHYSVGKMGDKIESKKLALEAKVNTIPGYNAAIAGPEQAVEIAKGIGYPVMIKASAGGGGKGLRVAFNDKEAFEGFTSCVNEAKNAFNDDRVFIEKYVLEPRHIEIQVLGDSFGNYVYLNERDCSIQRRHQKVIEEAPSPFVDPAMRKAMGEQAVALARAVQYESAGTVEFVVGADKSFYFLEMNTRLQVEHPVTELITGVDLVELMIRVAAGERLQLTQDQVQLNGWAMECRINAEDPFRGFLPSTGRLVKFQPPKEVPGQVRVDTGVYDGGEISMFYDSMIAKLIVHGATREQAISRMRDALNAFVIRGISSNIPFQAALMQHPRFQSGNFNTGFIAEEYPKGFDASMVPHDDPALLVSVAAYVYRAYTDRGASVSGQLQGHERIVGDHWCVVRLNPNGNENHMVVARPVSGGYHVEYKGESYEILSGWKLGESLFNGTCNGEEFTLQVERHKTRYSLFHWGTRADFMVMSARAAELLALMPEKPAPDLSKFLLSPMPGLLREVAVKVGQEVKAGEKLAVIEAMKMENILKADQDCKVKKVSAAAGESLTVDQVIIEFE